MACFFCTNTMSQYRLKFHCQSCNSVICHDCLKRLYFSPNSMFKCPSCGVWNHPIDRRPTYKKVSHPIWSVITRHVNPN